MRRVFLAAGAVLLTITVACAPKVIPVPVISAPRFPDFLKPAPAAAHAGTPAAASYERGWGFLQAGDFRNADREFGEALQAEPELLAARTALGYLDLAQRRPEAAITQFDRTLGRQPADPAALVGRGQALLTLEREDDALQAFEKALAADPSLNDLRVRIDVIRFRGLEQVVESARLAARDNRLDAAMKSYAQAISRSPDSAFLYREMAAVERRRGDRAAALQHFKRSTELDPADAGSHVQIGEILEEQGDLDGALAEYTNASSIEPGAEIDARRDALAARLRVAALPEQYRAIETSAEITRGDLAALIGVQLAPLLQASAAPDVSVATDVLSNWAESWIMAVMQARVMEPFANHTFQPAAVVRRIDLAEVVARLLTRVAAARPAQAQAWQNAHVAFKDLSDNHLAYPSASAAVAAGVIQMENDGRFAPARPVTGREATATIGRIQTLANLGRSTNSGAR